MTTPDNDTTNITPDTAMPEQVTIDRIADACTQNGIAVTADQTGRVAQGKHEGLDIMVVLLDSVFIVRADSETDTPADTPQPTMYLAANEINSAMLGARAIIGNRTEKLIVRTESEVTIAAGMTDAQLRSATAIAVGQVVDSHNAVAVIAEQIQEQMDQMPSYTTE